MKKSKEIKRFIDSTLKKEIPLGLKYPPDRSAEYEFFMFFASVLSSLIPVTKKKPAAKETQRISRFKGMDSDEDELSPFEQYFGVQGISIRRVKGLFMVDPLTRYHTPFVFLGEQIQSLRKFFQNTKVNIPKPDAKDAAKELTELQRKYNAAVRAFNHQKSWKGHEKSLAQQEHRSSKRKYLSYDFPECLPPDHPYHPDNVEKTKAKKYEARKPSKGAKGGKKK